MASPVALDLTRLFVSVLRGRPRGIERVDLDFIEALLGDSDREVLGVVAYPWGPRIVERPTLAALAASTRHLWREDNPYHTDPVLRDARRWLVQGVRPRRRHRRLFHLPRDIVSLVARTGLKRGVSLGRLPKGSLYLNVGQVGFAVEKATGFLAERPDLRAAAFLHDLLPIEEPEWFNVRTDTYFATVLNRMLSRCRAILVSTNTVANQLKAFTQRHRIPCPAVFVQPLVPSAALDYHAPPDPTLAASPYFVTCGTIEARKNQLFLLLLWREQLLAGRSMPKLIVAGVRGYGGAEAHDLLDRCAAIRSHVLEMPGLSSQALMHLIAHSRGLLMPTHAEGFGLPLAEALTLGVPAVASDLPVLSEASQGQAILVANDDGPAWTEAISRLAQQVPQQRLTPMNGFRPAQRKELIELITQLDETLELTS
ncbi:glycosyltransferase [Phreatobacter oligotrophus]|uniref:Glycosyltransferase involved in cell wall biosynthesis n=1 Tax=Phreatobacter oligotrophus TaxID=1122261 RepID=A0A2T4YWF8_9HYPH|nr:glycosyltransferase [Phreatobacter oligotrophus]PTM48449.1 glycosyltransferase involved in cell wall biosynthesis [Phreatobacter oligotrophus]